MSNVTGYIILIMIIALGASIYYNYYLSTLRARDRKKSKKIDKENRMLQYNLQRTQQQMEVCMAEKRNSRLTMEERTMRSPDVVSQKVNGPPRVSSMRYVSPAVGTASVLKRGVN